MKLLFLICAVLFCFNSCNQAGKYSKESVHVDSLVSVQKDEPVITLPTGFKLDTIQRKDTFSNTEIFISYPIFINTKTSVNSIVKNQLLKELDKFLEILSKPSHSGISNTFEIETDYVFSDDNTVSYRFITATYKSFTVHPFTFYKGFNYDLARDEQIVFSSYFHLKGIKR